MLIAHAQKSPIRTTAGVPGHTKARGRAEAAQPNTGKERTEACRLLHGLVALGKRHCRLRLFEVGRLLQILPDDALIHGTGWCIERWLTWTSWEPPQSPGKHARACFGCEVVSHSFRGMV